MARRYNRMALELLRAGADVNGVTREGSWGGDRSVLMFALGVDDSILYERSTPPKIDLKLLEELIKAGGDVTYVNKHGASPLSLARRKKNTRIIGLLKRHGAVA